MLPALAILVGTYLLVNLASFIAYILDKRAARRKGRRISERTLLLLALVAPFGAAAAMRAFRHKTRKTKFYLVYAFMVMHAALMLYIIMPAGKL